MNPEILSDTLWTIGIITVLTCILILGAYIHARMTGSLEKEDD